jgi:hypothetical protein
MARRDLQRPSPSPSQLCLSHPRTHVIVSSIFTPALMQMNVVNAQITITVVVGLICTVIVVTFVGVRFVTNTSIVATQWSGAATGAYSRNDCFFPILGFSAPGLSCITRRQDSMRRLSTDRPLFLREVRLAHDAHLCLVLTVTLVLLLFASSRHYVLED